MTHRPYPKPASPWVMRQRWHNLCFMHWPIPAALLRPLIPPGLEVDTFDGTAWIAVVPFRMSDVAPRFIPAVPGLSAFPELNVRTYVVRDGRPGVWFFSLEAANRLAVSIARTWFSLPYYRARMSLQREGETITYASERIHTGARPAALRARYRPVGPVFEARPGSLEWFLTARYCLYVQGLPTVTETYRPDAPLLRAEIEHPAWPLRVAEAEIERVSMTEPVGLTLPHTRPLLHYVEDIRVHVWNPAPIPT
ncbi:MAG: DUF2071 domain-containing protein [Thermoflexales bacterium]|nr:DUF2071 domain-containing protein [Thermoflexales bacterium]